MGAWLGAVRSAVECNRARSGYAGYRVASIAESAPVRWRRLVPWQRSAPRYSGTGLNARQRAKPVTAPCRGKITRHADPGAGSDP